MIWIFSIKFTVKFRSSLIKSALNKSSATKLRLKFDKNATKFPLNCDCFATDLKFQVWYNVYSEKYT